MAAQGGGGPSLFDQQMAAKISSPDEDNSQKDIIEAITSAAGKHFLTIAKMGGGVLPNVAAFGKTSVIDQPLGKSESWVDKPINQQTGPRGGLLAAIMNIFAKNREITDHTGGVGGNVHEGSSGEGGGSANSGGGGGGGDFGGGAGAGTADFQSFVADFAPQMVEYGGKMIAAGVSSDSVDVPMQRLSEISAPSVGASMRDNSAGVGMD